MMYQQIHPQVEPYMKRNYFNRKVVWTFTKWYVCFFKDVATVSFVTVGAMRCCSRGMPSRP